MTGEEQTAWAQALIGQVALSLAGRPANLTVELAEFPDQTSFVTCVAPIVLRAGVAAVPPANRPIPCRVAVRPDPGYPVLARISFVAPAAVRMASPRTSPGAAEAEVTWPASGEPDTRLPQLTVPAWFYELPEDVGLQPLPPSARRSQPGPPGRVAKLRAVSVPPWARPPGDSGGGLGRAAGSGGQGLKRCSTFRPLTLWRIAPIDIGC